MNEKLKIPIPVQILSGFLLFFLVLAPFHILASTGEIKRIYYIFNMDVNWWLVLLPIVPSIVYYYFLFLAWKTIKVKSNVAPNLFLYYYIITEILFFVGILFYGFLQSIVIMHFLSMDVKPSHEMILDEIILYSWPFDIGTIVLCIIWFVFWFYYFYKSDSVFKYYGSNASLLIYKGSVGLTHPAMDN